MKIAQVRLSSGLVIFCFGWLLPAYPRQPARAVEAALELTRAVVVAPANFSGPENKAVQMLIEEVEQRTQLRWQVVNQAPNDGTPFISINRPLTKAPLVREGYQIKTANNSVTILGNDARRLCDRYLGPRRTPS